MILRYLFRSGALFAMLILGASPLHATIHNISIFNFGFTPTNTTVAWGDTVTWTVTSGIHSTVSDLGSPKSWGSPLLGVGGTFSVIFSFADGIGPFPYHCGVHLFMQDTIFVDTCASQRPGDANSDGVIDVGDVGFLGTYLGSGGPAPNPLHRGDANGDCCVDSADLNYIIDFLFAGGPAPVICTCIYVPRPGDLNYDGLINLSDFGQLVSFLYSGGIPPFPFISGDVNNDCCMDTLDVLYLQAFLFGGGPRPAFCACAAAIVCPDSCAFQMPGDADGNGGINLGDISFLANYLGGTGPAPSPLSNGDANGDCCVDSLDLNYLSAFLFLGGPPPVDCTCFTVPRPGDADSDGQFGVGDIAAIANYLSGGTPPYPLTNADANGDCCVDSSDMTYMANFLFLDGPKPPFCTCSQILYPGDVDNNGTINIGDIAALVQYLSAGTPVPNPLGNADANGDCVVSPTDMLLLRDFLFLAGPPPARCACVSPAFCDCMPGDADDNFIWDVSDAVYLVAYIFLGGPAPARYSICSGDADCNCVVDISDAVYMIQFIFSGGPPPCGCEVWWTGAFCGLPLR